MLWSTGSRHLGFSSCSRWASVVVARGLSLPMECKNLPRPGLEPILPALAGRFEFTVPPGKSRPVGVFIRNYWDSWEKAMATHSSSLAWKTPWTEEPGRLQSMGSRRVGYERLHFHFSLSCTGEGNGSPLQCFCLENPRDGEPDGLPSMGSHSQTRLT